MFLLYHAYIYLELLILTCTIYILAPCSLITSTSHFLILGFMINSKDDYSEEEYNASLQNINENIEEIKQHLLDDSMIVKKETDRLTVKVYPN